MEVNLVAALKLPRSYRMNWVSNYYWSKANVDVRQSMESRRVRYLR